MLIDVHAHMDHEDFTKDIDELIQACDNAGVKLIISNGTNPETNRLTKKLSEQYPLIKPAYGYYPFHAITDGLSKVEEEIAWIKKQQPIALGEVGLDYKEKVNDQLHKEIQQEAFKKFIRLSKELDKPLIIHSRKAEEDVLNILEEEQAKKVVLHCFMGKKKYILRAKELGYTFSIPVTLIKLEQLQWLVEHVPLSQLLTETDAPYLGPTLERNDARNISLSIQKIATIKQMEETEVKNHIFMNYQKLFL